MERGDSELLLALELSRREYEAEHGTPDATQLALETLNEVTLHLDAPAGDPCSPSGSSPSAFNGKHCWGHLRIALSFKSRLLELGRRGFDAPGGVQSAERDEIPPQQARGGGRRGPPLQLDVPGSNDGEQGAFIAPPHLQPLAEGSIEQGRELGRGQFGTVHLGKWLGIEVALKELFKGTRDEMLREAEMLSSLRHPCVVSFFGVYAADNTLLTVTEFMRGGSLRAALRALQGTFQGPQKRATLARIAVKAARGVEYLHGRSVVHFDLKADNLLCDLSSLDSPIVKIGDLGLSKQKMNTFVSGSMRGTIPWMSPELFFTHQGSATQLGKVTEKVDVFSFGVVLWEIWQLGEVPYGGRGMSEIWQGVMSGTLRPEVPADCDPAWAELMVSCWAATAAARPSMKAVADALQEMASACDTPGDSHVAHTP